MASAMERMMAERFRNVIVVRKQILKEPALSLKMLYPGCELEFFHDPMLEPKEGGIWGATPTLCRLSRNALHLDELNWLDLLQQLDNSQCDSFVLSKNHPIFDTMHLYREGNRVLCFLEQLKQHPIPTGVEIEVVVP